MTQMRAEADTENRLPCRAFPMPTSVGNGADARGEQENLAGLQGTTQYTPWWVMTQTRAKSRENRVAGRALPNAHLGG